MWGGLKATNKPVASHANFDDEVDPDRVHIIICALDYKETKNPLTCSIDARNMKDLAAACGVSHITEMYNLECTKERVAATIRQVGAQCGDDDYFVFYYSGHGVNVPDQDGDEEDGLDECFAFVNQEGQITRESIMLDDDFARTVVSSLPQGCRIIVLTDCCHSGTIADLDNPEWRGRQAVGIAGCLDSQTSGDMGRGGIFTHSMLLAIDKLQKAEADHIYSVGLLFNATVHEDDEVFQSAQDITLHCAPGCTPDAVAWPLVPQEAYSAPLRKARQHHSLVGSLQAGAGALASLPTHALASLGISPDLAHHAVGLESVDEEIGEEYTDQHLHSGHSCSIQ